MPILAADKGRWFHDPHYKRLAIMKIAAMKVTHNKGLLLLAILLIAWGVVALILAPSALTWSLAILDIAAGIFILLGR